MFTVPEQFTNATKATVEAQLATMTAFAQKAVANAEKIVALNMTVVRESFAETTVAAQQLMAAKGAQEFIALATAAAKPNAEKVLAYGRELATIASAAQADFSREAESQIADTRQKVASLVDDVTKNAPTGTESVVAMVKTAMGNANAGFDQISNNAKQTADVIEANVTSTVSKFSEAVEKSTPRTAKK